MELRLVASSGELAVSATIDARLVLDESASMEAIESLALSAPEPADLELAPFDLPLASLLDAEPNPALPVPQDPEPSSDLRRANEPEAIGGSPVLAAVDGAGWSPAGAGAPVRELSTATPGVLAAGRAASREAGSSATPIAESRTPGPLSTGISAREPAIVPAVLLSRPKPEYPSLSVRLGEEGSVRCELSIDAHGTVVCVEVLRSSGFARLDQAARATLLDWRFAPARRDGAAIPSTLEHSVTFKLADARP